MRLGELAPWLNPIEIVFGVLVVALFLSFIRLVLGPSLPIAWSLWT